MILTIDHVEVFMSEDNIFNISLSEDDIDMCAHAINELCKSYLEDGVNMDNETIQKYLNLSRRLDDLFD